MKGIPHPREESDEPQGAECLEGPSCATDTSRFDNGGNHVDEQCDEDEEVDDVPDAEKVGIGSEDEPICDDLDEEFQNESACERYVGGVEPGIALEAVVAVVLPSVCRGGNGSDDNATNDGQEDEELEERLGDGGRGNAEDAVSACRRYEFLAQTS